MLATQENPKPEESLLSITQSEKPIRLKLGRRRSGFITRQQLRNLTSTSQRRRSNVKNTSTKQRNNTTTQQTQHNPTPQRIGHNQNIYANGHTLIKNHGEGTLRVVCGSGSVLRGCVVKWLSAVCHSIVACVRGHAHSLYTFTTTATGYMVKLLCSSVSHIVTVCSHVQAQFCSTHRAQFSSDIVAHSLTSHPNSTHKKGGTPVGVRILCWGVWGSIYMLGVRVFEMSELIRGK